MTTPKIFEDRNVCVYAYGTTAERKRDRALEGIQELWNSETGVISKQVLQELFECPFGIRLFSKRLVEVEPQPSTLKIFRMGNRSRG